MPMSMYKKQTLYQQEGKRLISVYPAALPRLGALLVSKLRIFGYAVTLMSEAKSGEKKHSATPSLVNNQGEKDRS